MPPGPFPSDVHLQRAITLILSYQSRETEILTSLQKQKIRREMEKRRGVATSGGREGGWKPAARAGFRSRLGPDPAYFFTRTGRRGAGARRTPRPHTAGCSGTARGASCARLGRPGPLPRRPQSGPRAHPLAALPEVPPAPAPHWAQRRGLAAGWPPAGRSLGPPLRAPGVGPGADPLRRGVARGRRGRRRGVGSAGAARGTSVPGPGRGRATADGSCSPAVVGGARGSCAVHRGLFHICNNR